jgi:hypothetical protein
MSSWIETLKSGSFLLVSCLAHFDPEKEGHIFLLNLSELVANYAVPITTEPLETVVGIA